MSRDLHPDVQSALAAPVVRPALIAELHFASGVLYMTDLPYDLQHQGTTYRGGGSLVSVDVVRESDALEATGLSFSITGVPTGNVALALGEHIQGRTARLSVLLLSADNVPIGPPMVEWSGRLDQMRIEDGVDSATITVTAESRLADFKRSYVRRYTHEDHQLEHPGDRFFDHMQGTVEKQIVWPSRHWYIDIGS